MKEYIEELISRRNALISHIEYLESDAVMADGQAYYAIKDKIAKAWTQVNQMNAEIDRFTFVGPRMPEWVRAERNQKVLDESRKSRIQSALEKIEKLFGKINRSI